MLMFRYISRIFAEFLVFVCSIKTFVIGLGLPQDQQRMLMGQYILKKYDGLEDVVGAACEGTHSTKFKSRKYFGFHTRFCMKIGQSSTSVLEFLSFYFSRFFFHFLKNHEIQKYIFLKNQKTSKFA